MVSLSPRGSSTQCAVCIGSDYPPGKVIFRRVKSGAVEPSSLFSVAVDIES
jgi:hypothetical protein